jgi:hypothetical protein
MTQASKNVSVKSTLSAIRLRRFFLRIESLNRIKNASALLWLLTSYCASRQPITEDRPMPYETFRPIFNSVSLQPRYQLIPTIRVAISSPTDIYKIINFMKEKFPKESHLNRLTGGAVQFEVHQEKLISVLDALNLQYKFKVESYSNSRGLSDDPDGESDFPNSSIAMLENSEKRLTAMMKKESNVLEKLKQEHELEKVRSELKQLRDHLKNERARKPIIELNYIQIE